MLFDKYRERIKTVFNKERIVRFLDKQGFYIVLFICISIIGVTALLTSGREADPQDGVDGDMPPLENIADENDENLISDMEENGQELEDIDIEVKDVITGDTEEEQENIEISDLSDSKSEENIEDSSPNDDKDSLAESEETAQKDNDEEEIKKEVNIEDSEDGNVESNADVKPVSSQQETSKFVMVYPVEGEVLKQYAMDELVYSNTLKEWTTHPGMDIESFLGAEVKAAMDGTVEKVEEDPLMGIMITLNHGDGIKTRYANLSTANMVAEGQNVKAGQVISGVGRTAGAEILDASHLHFELIIDGEYVNPAEYLQ